MKISQPKISYAENTVIIESQIDSSLSPKVLSYSLAKEFADLTCDYSDAFLVALLLPAMACGEDIYVEGTVSEQLWYMLSQQYQSIVQAQMPWLKRIKIFPTHIEARHKKALGVATGFSGGIDSFCLLGDHFYSSLTPGFKITHLLFNNVGSHGSGSVGEILFEKRYMQIKNMVESLKLPLIKVNSNLDAFYESYGPQLDFEQAHTPRNASVALLLQKGIGKYMYASAFSFADVKVKPSRSTAYTDPIALPMLSTEILNALPVGSEYTRVEKILRVADIPDSYTNLNICVGGDTAGNCSKCWKCIRTILTMEIAKFMDKYSNVFNYDIYYQHRDQHIATMFKSKNPNDHEVIEFAKQNRFTLLPSLVVNTQQQNIMTPIVNSKPHLLKQSLNYLKTYFAK